MQCTQRILGKDDCCTKVIDRLLWRQFIERHLTVSTVNRNDS